MALEIEKSLRCQMCGTAQWEWDEDRFAYEVTQELCMGCYHRESASRNTEDAPGVTLQLSSTKTPEARERRDRLAAIHEREQAERASRE